MKRVIKPNRTEDSYAEMILRFAIAAEYKDAEIGEHIIRVSDYSTAIARSLNLTPKEIETIRFTSIMHDIGKIGISERVLHRKRISAKEFDKIKEHTTIGNKIFVGSSSPLLKAAGEVALSHHEWYDGSGYPLGLKGHKIPLMARIVALADSFDAIVSERSYKRSESIDKAIDIIKKHRGSQFDPKVVDAFLKALSNIREVFRASKTISDFLRENKKIIRKR